MEKIKQPILTVCGHVDHGKTSILDSLRGSSVQEGEAGGITQKISFTSYPIDKLKKDFPIIENSGLNIDTPGFLFIDTPGHAAFTNLRKRGGSLADLAVLVVDINEGIKPQTAEVIQILKHNKTPFVIALNKIDNISGWRTSKESTPLKQSIESQPINTKQAFDERYMTIMGALSSYGFDADLFYNISDFTKKIALVPTSARTKEGIPELMMVICGISQKYLHDRIKLGEDARGVILEVKKEKSMNYAEAILHDGELSKKDEIAIASFEEPIITGIRILEEIEPLSTRFTPKESARASTGLRLQFSAKADVLSGMPFVVFKGNKEEIRERFQKEIFENIKTGKQGIIAKADSLGSLEALLTLLGESNIPVVKAGIGNINKTDIISGKANFEINELDAIVIGFNVGIDEEAEEMKGNVKVFTDNVVYKLIENLEEYRGNKTKEIEKKRMMGLTTLCKLRVLHQFVFRNTKPAIFGARIEKGKLVSDLELIDQKGEKAGRIKNIQSENKSVSEASEGKEVAVSMPNVNFERQMKDRDFLYSNLSESQFRKFKKNKDLLSSAEINLLQEIAEIKRQNNPEWGV